MEFRRLFKLGETLLAIQQRALEIMDFQREKSGHSRCGERTRISNNFYMRNLQPSNFIALLLKLYLTFHKVVFGKRPLQLEHNAYFAKRRQVLFMDPQIIYIEFTDLTKPKCSETQLVKIHFIIFLRLFLRCLFSGFFLIGGLRNFCINA
jgi:hypothetical protein